MQGLENKLKVLFYKPGWLPAEYGGMRPIPDVQRDTAIKYEQHIPLGLNYYLLVQYVLTLAGTAIFMFNTGGLSFAHQVAVVSYILLSVGAQGGLFDARKWAFVAEYARLFLLSVLAYWVFQAQPFALPLGLGLGAFAVLSAVWLRRFLHLSAPQKA